MSVRVLGVTLALAALLLLPAGPAVACCSCTATVQQQLPASWNTTLTTFDQNLTNEIEAHKVWLESDWWETVKEGLKGYAATDTAADGVEASMRATIGAAGEATRDAQRTAAETAREVLKSKPPPVEALAGVQPPSTPQEQQDQEVEKWLVALVMEEQPIGPEAWRSREAAIEACGGSRAVLAAMEKNLDCNRRAGGAPSKECECAVVGAALMAPEPMPASSCDSVPLELQSQCWILASKVHLVTQTVADGTVDIGDRMPSINPDQVVQIGAQGERQVAGLAAVQKITGAAGAQKEMEVTGTQEQLLTAMLAMQVQGAAKGEGPISIMPGTLSDLPSGSGPGGSGPGVLAQSDVGGAAR